MRRSRRRPVGPLHCTPVLLKDQSKRATCRRRTGSAVFKEFAPLRDATVVTKLKKAGRSSSPRRRWASSRSRYTGSAFGAVRNPSDPTRNASGSSGDPVRGWRPVTATRRHRRGHRRLGCRGPASVESLVGPAAHGPLVSRFGMLPSTPDHRHARSDGASGEGERTHSPST